MKSKIGMSGIVVAIVMIALALFLGAIVWGIVNNLVKEEIGKGSSCFGIYDKIKVVVQEGLKELALTALNNAIDNYVQNLAYQTAVYVATGDAGQKPLIWKQPIGKALADVGDAVVGDFLDRLSTDIFGHSICEPINPQFNLQVAFLLESTSPQKPPEPGCSWLDIRDALGQSVENIKAEGLRFSNLQIEDVVKFSNYFDPRSNNLGQLVELDRDLRMELAKEGIPGQDVVGFEKFDGSTLGMSSYVQRINYVRAVQGELIRSIERLKSVRRARVHISIPPKKTVIATITAVIIQDGTDVSKSSLLLESVFQENDTTGKEKAAG